MKEMEYTAPSRAEINDRVRLGLDRRDELWEGVYHVVPVPNGEHQFVATRLAKMLDAQAVRRRLGEIRWEQGIKDQSRLGRDYRVPEWIFLRRRAARWGEDGYVEGEADAVCEVLSPHDDTWKKKPFYERMGVKELLVVDPKPRRVWLFQLVDGRYVEAPPKRGWVTSAALKASFRTGRRKGKPALLVRLDLEKHVVAI